MKVNILSIIAILFIIVTSVLFLNIETINADSNANDTMVVEVNLLGFGNASETPEVGIEVSDYIFLGNVSKDTLLSDEKTITLNNAGKVNITITPQLADSDEEIFKWLFFRNYKSSTVHPDEAIPKKIGSYSVSIDKPAAGKNKRPKDIYIRLNLTEFDGQITEDIIGHKSEVVFFAMAG